MNRQAQTQRRIQPKQVDEENEKYAMRIWLIRIGMKGADFKETRRILLEKLSGNSAFRTEDQRLAALDKEKQRRKNTAAENSENPSEDTGETEVASDEN